MTKRFIVAKYAFKEMYTILPHKLVIFYITFS